MFKKCLQLLFRTPLTGLIVGSFVMAGVVKYSDVFRQESEYYEAPDPEFKTSLKLVEKSEELGLINLHSGIFPPSRDQSPQSYSNLISGVAPSVAVIDINDDGFFDVYVTNPGLGAKNKLFINQAGHGFKEEAERWGLADVNQESFSEVALFADVNNDGHPDLILGRSGCHSIYLNEFPKKHFKELKNAFNGYCSNARGLAILDTNKDGLRDIFVANYFASVDLNKEFPPWSSDFPRGDDSFGGKNVLLEGQGHGFFKVSPRFDFPYKNHTFFPGVGDFNKDGWPDIFEGNDFSFDRLYYNRKGTFEEVTATDLPMNHHGFAGMNSEVFDFNHDGWLDIYVSNIYGPPYSRSGNILWRGGPQGFRDVSDEMGVRRCGWSWGAKFVDLDLDGKEELIVGGGMVRGKNVHSVHDGQLYWYRVGQKLATPYFLRKYITEIHDGEKMNYFGYQRGCLFQWDEPRQKYTDVAPLAGFDRIDNSRALALIDFDNDGRVDILTGNYNDYLRLYHNESTAKKSWLGFDLKLNRSSSDPVIGARVRIFRQQKLIYYREVYPANGHRGQNDPRIVLAVDSAADQIVEVKWPDDVIEIFDQFKINSYNPLIKNNGKRANAEIIPKI